MSITFADLGAPGEVVAALAATGVTEPLPIQTATIPDAIAGRDICGSAPTGSGKTLAFGIPLVVTVERGRPGRPRALVLAPTRELAEQIRTELETIAVARRVSTLAVYGGVGYEGQRRSLHRGVDVLVACPGRLADLVQHGWVRLDDVDRVVIDEADRMSDMGFLPEVRRLLDMTSPDRQTMLFSATLDGDVAALTKRYQRDPVRHEVEGVGSDAIDARHFFWRAEAEERIEQTAGIVTAASPTIIFCRTRHGVDRLARHLEARGVSVAPIHGGHSQSQRSRALLGFSRGKVQALVATDVAARGIHVDGVACVLHFDPPADAKAYLHRSGRTARVGTAGVVVSLIAPDQAAASRRLQGTLGLNGGVQPFDLASLGEGGERIDGTRRPGDAAHLASLITPQDARRFGRGRARHPRARRASATGRYRSR
ncbi:MAG: RNA helicase [Actinobacteria bacterium RBG_16_70_17]|nr:MAG: RNA helicase [Actinobacteria bacterium RBG_16_70_17]